MSNVSTPQYPSSRGSGAAGMSTPQYPPPPVLGSSYGSRYSPPRGSVPGSRSSLSRAPEAAPIHLDPQLINPADAAPAGTAMDVPPSSPDEITPFPVDDFEVTMRKKPDKGGFGSKFKGGFGRMKGLFKKSPQQAQTTGTEIEDEEYDVTASEEYLDKIGTSGADGGDKQSTMQKFQSMFKKSSPPEPQMASPSPYQPGDIMTLNEPPPATKLTFGNFINVMLICFMVIGVIMCACIGVNDALYYLGPAFIGLAFFALVGKLFFTNCFMEDHPLDSQPEWVKTAAHYAEQAIGGEKDPYGFNTPGRLPWYDGPMVAGPLVTKTTTTTVTDVYNMETIRAPSYAPSGPKMYDESIDTRLRYASKLYRNCVTTCTKKLFRPNSGKIVF